MELLDVEEDPLELLDEEEDPLDDVDEEDEESLEDDASESSPPPFFGDAGESSLAEGFFDIFLFPLMNKTG